MNINLTGNNLIVYENDLEDFKLPYKLQSKTDIEVMQCRYENLTKTTYGYIVRLGLVSADRTL